jgi:hypothetical protein
VTTAAADGNGDGFLEVGVGAGPSGGPRVSIFSGSANFPWVQPAKIAVRDYFAFEPSFTGGVSISGGDVTGDGVDDLAIAAGPGGGPIVAIYDGMKLAPNVPLEQATWLKFFTDDPQTRGGNTISVRDLDSDGLSGVLAGTGRGSKNPRAGVWQVVNQKAIEVASQPFLDDDFLLGVSVA